MENINNLIRNMAKYKKIFWFSNINFEQNWERSKSFPIITDIEQLTLVEQQEQQMLLLADKEDVVLLSHSLEKEYINYLSTWKKNLPEIIISKNIPWEHINREKGILYPYLCTEELVYASNDNNANIFFENYKLVKDLNNKFLTRKLAEEYGFNTTSGLFCENIDELIINYKKLMLNFSKVVVKIPYGSSGKGLKIIESTKQFNQFINFIKKRSTKLNFLIEGWYEVSTNINSQLFITDSGYKILSVNEQLIDNYGSYLGTRFKTTFNDSIIKEYTKEIEKLGSVLYEKGYRGIAGIDSIIDKKNAVFPIIEINARLTQVTYLLPLINQFSKKYSFIESRFIKLESQQNYNFKYIHEYLVSILEPNQENDFRIYIFAKKEFQNKTLYRIFALFFGNNSKKQSEMILKFINVSKDWERSPNDKIH